MGIVISNGPEGVHFCKLWGHMLKLGMFYGWKPRGTDLCLWKDHATGTTTVGCLAGTPEDSGEWLMDKEWDGNYTSNDGQMMTIADSLALATALEQAKADIPDHYVDYKTIILKREKPDSWTPPDVDDEDREPSRRRCLAIFTHPEACELLDHVIEILKHGPCTIH